MLFFNLCSKSLLSFNLCSDLCIFSILTQNLCFFSILAQNLCSQSTVHRTIQNRHGGGQRFFFFFFRNLATARNRFWLWNRVLVVMCSQHFHSAISFLMNVGRFGHKKRSSIRTILCRGVSPSACPRNLKTILRGSDGEIRTNDNGIRGERCRNSHQVLAVPR